MSRLLPPVIVVGIDTPIGLTVVRELGSHGIQVHGVARSRRALGLYSRRLARGYMRPADEAQLPGLLRRIALESGAAFVMTVSMADALAVRAAADAGLLPGLKPLLPSLDRLRLVNDKAAVCAIAERLGIATPSTWEPGAADWAEPPADVDFPCVLKWRDPDAAAAQLEACRLPLHKSEYARDRDELEAALARYAPAGIWPMVQSYCPGTGLGQMFVMKDGAAMLRFQHRRLHEWPPEGGTSTLCESLPAGRHAALLERSEALLREIGWEGPAMVEYRFDPATGRAVLMEINGRFWGSLPLAWHAGAPFALATYYALGLDQPMPAAPPYRAGVRCRYMIPETRRLLRVTFARHAIPDRAIAFSPFRELLSYLKGFGDGSRCYVFAFRDPLPFLADTAFVLREAFGRAAGALSALPGARLRGRAGRRARAAR